MEYFIRPWSKRLLQFAGTYNLIWGLVILFAYTQLFAYAGVEPPRYPFLIQGVAGVVFLFGIGYLIAAQDPYRHWVLIFMAFLLKLGAFIATLYYTFSGFLPQEFFWFSFANDFLWLFPFGYILKQVFQQSETERYFLDRRRLSVESDYLNRFQDQNGIDLQTITQKQPTLFIFLRHFGCSFCKEAIRDLAEQKKEIEAQGSHVVLIHMSPADRAVEMAQKHGLENISWVSDPDRRLYQAFQLNRGNFQQMFGWKSWIRAAGTGLGKGIWPSWREGDGWQMPGAFLLYKGEILQSFRHTTASDRPDYLTLAQCEVCG